MKISEILKTKKTISFEVFPPKKDKADFTSILQTIDELSILSPDFISVTYGAGGSTRGKTVEIASMIKNKYNIEALAHLTCIGNTKKNITEICDELKNNNIDNIMALRGDYPKDFTGSRITFHHANELDEFIKSTYGDHFCLGGACYPETHLEAACFEDDLQNLKAKYEAGADFLVTQIFFDNNYYYRLLAKARQLGIKAPIIAGIMPITNSRQLIKTARMCGCSIPYQLSTMLETYVDDPQAMREIGINYATHQIIDLIANGADGIHIYTMNKPDIARSIFTSIPTVLEGYNGHD